MNYEENEF